MICIENRLIIIFNVDSSTEEKVIQKAISIGYMRGMCYDTATVPRWYRFENDDTAKRWH